MSRRPVYPAQSARVQAWSSLAPMNITDYLVIAAILISAAVGSVRVSYAKTIALVTWIIAVPDLATGSHRPSPGWAAGGVSRWQRPGRRASSSWRSCCCWARASGRSRTLSACPYSAAWTAFSASCSVPSAASCCSAFCDSGATAAAGWRALVASPVLLPYGESIANGLRAVIGEERVRHASSRAVSRA